MANWIAKYVNQLAHELVRLSTEEPNEVPVSSSDISRVMREMGRRGGKKGGKRRLETMTPEERSQVAHKAAQARWAKEKQKKED